jgi:hypothetical protein
MAKSDLTAERVRELLDYDPATGVFVWKVKRGNNGRRAGEVAGSVRVDGYLAIGVDRYIYTAHRLAWLYIHGEWPGKDLDHVNGIKTDNRLANVRLATHSQNMCNQRVAQKNNKAGLLGVSPHHKKWQATIGVNGVKLRLGRFDTAQEAHEAYLSAKRKHHSFATI